MGDVEDEAADLWERISHIEYAVDDMDHPDVLFILSVVAGRVLACLEPGKHRDAARRDLKAMLRDAERQAVIAQCDA